MAQLKSTLVQGNLTATGQIVANKIIKQGGTSRQILMADGSVSLPGDLQNDIDSGVTKVNITGDGNAVTSASVSDDTRTLTLNRGLTFLTEHQSLANYVTLNGNQEISGVKTFTTKQNLNAGASLNQTGVFTWPALTKDNDVQKYFELYVEDVLGVKYGGTAQFTVAKNGDITATGKVSGSSASFTNYATAKGYKIPNKTDADVVLAGGGTRTVESIKALVEIPNINLTDSTVVESGYTYPVIGDISVSGHDITIVRKSLKDLGLNTVYKYKGTVTWVTFLAIKKAEVGDVYNISDADKYNLTGSDWACHTAYNIASTPGNYNPETYWQALGGRNDMNAILGDYLPLTGSSCDITDLSVKQPNNMTGCIAFYQCDGIKINSANQDLKIWEVFGDTGKYSRTYGFHLLYQGSGSGVNNNLVLYAHNQQGTHKVSYTVNQNGLVTFETRPKVVNGATSTEVALRTDLPEYVDTNTWRPINIKIGSSTTELGSNVEDGTTLTVEQGTNTTFEYNSGRLTISSADTKNTVGATNSTDEIMMVGVTTQGASQVSYSTTKIKAKNGVLTTTKTNVGDGAVTMEYDTTYKALKFKFA
jgi:hypothetical protein